jgi:hypothetical protein
MEFLFKPQGELNKGALFQGDILSRTPVLKEALSAAHSYYSEAEDYTHFMVLTQSCDLVRREGRPARSRYITLAACRPVSVLFGRQKFSQREKIDGFPVPVFSTDKRPKAGQLLERLLHNTEDGHFFVRRGSVAGIDEDLCAFLPLSVALRAEAHYEACASSKIAELQDVFAAKLGWMTGNLYSRVGTPDIEDHVADPDAYKRAFIDQFLAEESAWLSPVQVNWLQERVRKWRKENKPNEMSIEEGEEILRSVPTTEAIIADQVVAALQHNKLLDPENADKARNILSSSPAIKRASRAIAASQ